MQSIKSAKSIKSDDGNLSEKKRHLQEAPETQMASRRERKDSTKQVFSRVLAEEASEPLTTIDFWSKERLLVYKIKGRKRLYPLQQNLEIIKMIRELQENRVTIEEIKKKIHHA